MTNALAYDALEFITTVKCFITQGPERNNSGVLNSEAVQLEVQFGVRAVRKTNKINK